MTNPETAQNADGSATPLGALLDVPVRLHVEMGRKSMRIAEVLELGPGSVVAFDTAAGAPLAIYANDILVAHGEAVVIDERYGVRVTELVAPSPALQGAKR